MKSKISQTRLNMLERHVAPQITAAIPKAKIIDDVWASLNSD